jgi:hypothetical protein
VLEPAQVASATQAGVLGRQLRTECLSAKGGMGHYGSAPPVECQPHFKVEHYKCGLRPTGARLPSTDLDERGRNAGVWRWQETALAGSREQRAHTANCDGCSMRSNVEVTGGQ